MAKTKEQIEVDRAQAALDEAALRVRRLNDELADASAAERVAKQRLRRAEQAASWSRSQYSNDEIYR